MISYNEVVSHLEQRVQMPDRPPSLIPVLEALKELNLKFDSSRTILVAGTNGKGTVSATLATLLAATGAKVGLYTSPHLVDTCERIQVDLKPVSQKTFVEAFRAVKEKISNPCLSHFEMLTLMAHFIFVTQNCDWLIYEVGLGGKWDATNAIEHKTSVICRLGLDHQDILGKGLWNIAQNKLGIVRNDPQHQVIHLPFPEEIKKEIENFKTHCQASFYESQIFNFRITNINGEPQYIICTPWGEALLNLMGKRAVENTSLALTVFEKLGFSLSNYLNVLSQVHWPGRMDYQVNEGKKIFFSGDHNPQGVESLCEIVNNLNYENLWAIVGIGKSKEANEMIKIFTSIPRLKLLLTETPFRGLKINEYSLEAKKIATWMHASPQEVLKFALQRANQRDLILVSGSLYLVGAIKKFLSQANG